MDAEVMGKHRRGQLANSGGAGDAESQLKVRPHGPQRQQRPVQPADCGTALLSKATILLSQSSEPTENTLANSFGDSRDLLKTRAAAFHGHIQCSACSQSTEYTSRTVAPGAWEPCTHREQLTGLAESDRKPALRRRTKYLFESAFLTSLPANVAKEGLESAMTETCAPMQAPSAEKASFGTAERPECAIFRCSGPAQQLLPSRICADPPLIDRRECRTAAYQTDNVTATSTEFPPLLPHSHMSDPLHTIQKSNWMGEARHDRQQRPNKQKQKSQSRIRNVQIEEQKEGQQRLRGEFSCRAELKELGVLRTIGHRLNSFFCPGNCGSSPGHASLETVTTHLQMTTTWEPSLRTETARCSKEPAVPLHSVGSPLRFEVPSETFLAVASSLESCSIDQASDISRSAAQRKERRRPHDDCHQPETDNRQQSQSGDIHPHFDFTTCYKAANSGFECLLQALEQERQRRLLGTRMLPKACSHFGSARSQRQVSHALRFPDHTFEVACEIISADEEGDADENDEEALGENQSNAVGCGCRERQLTSDALADPDEHFSITGDSGGGKSCIEVSSGCIGQMTRHQSRAEMIGSAAQSILTLSHNLQCCVRRIRGAVAQLHFDSS